VIKGDQGAIRNTSPEMNCDRPGSYSCPVETLQLTFMMDSPHCVRYILYTRRFGSLPKDTSLVFKEFQTRVTSIPLTS
jgi:hypothetical protein